LFLQEKENDSRPIDRDMRSFMHFLLAKKPLPLNEVSDLFQVEQFNDYWKEQLDRVIPTITDPEIRKDLLSLRDLNLIGYVDRSLRRAGIPMDDLDEAVQQVVIKLLVSPGKLITGWKKDSPLSFRLKAAIRNAAISLGQSYSRRKKRRQDLPPDLPARMSPDDGDLIHQFRQWLGQRLGEVAVRVFDWRLEDRDSRELIGSEGIPTSHSLKMLVRKIKAAAIAWGRSDPEFLVRVQKLMGAEEATLGKRFPRRTVSPVA
jgi:hypothetical protein